MLPCLVIDPWIIHTSFFPREVPLGELVEFSMLVGRFFFIEHVVVIPFQTLEIHLESRFFRIVNLPSLVPDPLKLSSVLQTEAKTEEVVIGFGFTVGRFKWRIIVHLNQLQVEICHAEVKDGGLTGGGSLYNVKVSIVPIASSILLLLKSPPIMMYGFLCCVLIFKTAALRHDISSRNFSALIFAGT